MNKMDYNTKIKDFNSLIESEEKKINDAKNEISKLKVKLDNFKMSCDHKNDDGSSAMKNTNHWVSSPYTYIDSWTGEESEGDDGYTQYEETCDICYKSFER